MVLLYLFWQYRAYFSVRYCPKYTYSQLKWALLERPALREAYVRGKINEELDDVLSEAEATFDRFARDYIVVFN